MVEKKTLWKNDQIFTLDDALTQKECQQLIESAESKGFKASSPSGGGHGRTGREDPRTSQFCVFDNDEEWPKELWERVRPFLPPNVSHLSASGYITPRTQHETQPVFVHPRIRVYKYEPGQTFPEHVDYKQRRIVWRNGVKAEQMSYMTLLVYLNDDFAGGETGFWTQHNVIGAKEHCRFLRDVQLKPHQVVVQPKQGRVLICDQNLLHEGLPPRTMSNSTPAAALGVKYVLRTDIVYERTIPLHPKLARATSQPDCEGEWERLFETSCKNYAE